MHSYAVKYSNFTKLGSFSLKYRNLSKVSMPAAPKMCHVIQLYPKKFQNSHFSAPSAPKNVSLNAKFGPPFGRCPPPPHSIASLASIKNHSNLTSEVYSHISSSLSLRNIINKFLWNEKLGNFILKTKNYLSMSFWKMF